MIKVDMVISSLCEEIDHLRKEVEYWKELYENERADNFRTLNDNLEIAKQGVANALLFALSVSDDENGNLVISKKDRQDLAENWK